MVGRPNFNPLDSCCAFMIVGGCLAVFAIVIASGMVSVSPCIEWADSDIPSNGDESVVTSVKATCITNLVAVVLFVLGVVFLLLGVIIVYPKLRATLEAVGPKKKYQTALEPESMTDDIPMSTSARWCQFS